MQLRFSIDSKAHQTYKRRWDYLICMINNIYKERVQILEFWKSQTKLLPILDRCEGGLGGTDKQVRFDVHDRINPTSGNYIKITPID